MPKQKKILAVASVGGHWIQLLRITRQLEKFYEVTYISTHNKCEKMVVSNKFYHCTDFSRWNIWKIIPVFFKLLKIVTKEKPMAIISTGAAPGLVAIFVGKLFNKKTIWIDSIANVTKLSLSGKIASHIATRTYTQWKDLSSDKITYDGNILG